MTSQPVLVKGDRVGGEVEGAVFPDELRWRARAAVIEALHAIQDVEHGLVAGSPACETTAGMKSLQAFSCRVPWLRDSRC